MTSPLETAATDQMTVAAGEMTLVEHLEELRWRIIKSVLAIAGGFVICFIYHVPLISLLLAPARRLKVIATGGLVFTSPAEYFMAALKSAFFGGVFLALPVLLYQLVAFVSPGLDARERRWSWVLVAGAALLFAAGASFSYFALLPVGFNFLIGFAPASVVHPMLSVGAVLDFSTVFLFATGAIFQLPIIMLGLALIGVLTSQQLRRYRKIFIVIAFLIGALLSPSPDVLSQALLAGALLVLFELSIKLIQLAGK
ncbi:MAG: twin-arginine translocase subunit TatC [Cyanobacteria bacterium NC_groundwater_1444_Ag_S-0.65um_54_12]|nr:twin-arginine translocase subunit TatC [Cyanobacteria bacterium NC_groundwater_1444_Ag_S-0.65um_54_12]